jgi:hypothetical protein
MRKLNNSVCHKIVLNFQLAPFFNKISKYEAYMEESVPAGKQCFKMNVKST